MRDVSVIELRKIFFDDDFFSSQIWWELWKPLMSSVVTLLPPATNSSLMSEYISKTNQQIPAIPSWTVRFLITLIF